MYHEDIVPRNLLLINICKLTAQQIHCLRFSNPNDLSIAVIESVVTMKDILNGGNIT